jgi:DNA-binding response OmpR family regulator
MEKNIILFDLCSKKEINSLIKKIEENKEKEVIVLIEKSLIDYLDYLIDKGIADYIVKPFSDNELSARIKLRRRFDIIVLENISLNKNSCTLKNLKTEKEVFLNSKEYKLSSLFFENQNKILSKDFINNKIWGYNSDCIYNNVEVYISFLRKKLDKIEADIQILSKRGLGYLLTKK